MSESSTTRSRGIPSFLIRKAADHADHADTVVEAGAGIEPGAQVLPSPVGLPPNLERQRLASIKRLGERWLLHPAHSPRKASYNGQGFPT